VNAISVDQFARILWKAAFAGGMVGGALSQLTLGAFFLVRVVNARCARHAERIASLEKGAVPCRS